MYSGKLVWGGVAGLFPGVAGAYSGNMEFFRRVYGCFGVLLLYYIYTVYIQMSLMFCI